MQELFAAGIARHDRAHRIDHVIVAIDFVDEGDARLGILVGAGDDPVPDVGRDRPIPGRAALQSCNRKDRQCRMIL